MHEVEIMKLFLDSADVEKIKGLAATGLVDGITTNPTIILRGGRAQKEAILQICKLIKGPVSVEGIGSTCDEMVKDGREFSKWASNIVVKVPMSAEGMKAVRILEKEGIPTNVTLVFSPAQALLAAKAGASYCSPFVGRLDDASEHGMHVVEEILQIFRAYNFKTQLIVASIRTQVHVVQAAKLGAPIATMPPEIFEKLFCHPLTDKGIELFLQDYKKAIAGKK